MSSISGVSTSNSSSTSTTSSISSSISSSTTSSTSSSTSSSTTSSTLSSTTSTTSSTTSTTSSTLSTSSIPGTTQVVTSIATRSPNHGSTQPPVTVIVTSVRPATKTAVPVVASSHSSTTSSTQPQNTSGDTSGGSSGGLSKTGVTAIAVVVPVVAVALLLALAFFLWRKRKQKKAAEDARRKEVEDYGFNPNNDPTLPAVASEAGGPAMSEDQSSGYRGWGTAGASNRKMSTTLSGGLTQGQMSENGNPQYANGGSPNGGYSDGQSGDALVNRRETMTSDDLGALGGAPVTQQTSGQGPRRGTSNASSTYSHGNHSDVSDDRPNAAPVGQAYDYNPTNGGFGYSQHGPYGDGTYGGDAGMPVVQDVSARRNTRIQQPGNYQQGNSGIAQNF